MTDRKNWQVGASTCFYGRFDAEVAALYARAGIKQVELSLAHEQFAEMGFLKDPSRILKIAADAGIILRSLHIPFSGEINWSLPDEKKRLENVRLAKDYIDACSSIGITINVIHPSSEPIAEESREIYMLQSIKSLSELSAYAESKGVKLAVENLPRTCLCRCSDEMIRLLKACPKLFMCFDTNHNLMQDNASFINDVAQSGARIIAIHVSDYDFINERHWLPRTENSKNDWHSIILALENADYDGTFTYEVGSMGKYTFEDLAQNAKMLFTL